MQVVLDGVVNPLLATVSQFDVFSSRAGFELLNYCLLDERCAAAMAPWGGAANALTLLLEQLDRGTQPCVNAHFGGAGITSALVRDKMFQLMQAGNNYLSQSLIVPFVYHMHHCNVKALETFFAALNKSTVARNGAGGGPVLFSTVLNYNIVESERWLAVGEAEVDANFIAQAANASLVAPSNTMDYLRARPFWPRYALDKYRGVIGACNSCRILMLNGELDPATPFVQAASLAAATQGSRSFVAVPLVGHVTSLAALDGQACPLSILLRFLADGVVDAACVSRMPSTIDFSGATAPVQKQSATYFGCSAPFACR